MRRELAAAAEAVGERVLDTPSNPISMAMTLNRLETAVFVASSSENVSTESEAADAGISSHEKEVKIRGNQNPTFFGSMLWAR